MRSSRGKCCGKQQDVLKCFHASHLLRETEHIAHHRKRREIEFIPVVVSRKDIDILKES
jgi:hypothetical protein